MTFTEYAKSNKYVVVYGIEGKNGDMLNSNRKNLYKVSSLSYLKFEDDEPIIFEAILEEKPKLTFEDIQELITEKLGYGYLKTNDSSIKREITRDQVALDFINNILADRLIQYTSYNIGRKIKLTGKELEKFCNISKGAVES